MARGDAPSEESVARLRRAVLRLARDLRRTSAEEDLSPAQSSALATVVREGPLRSGDLAAAEGLNPTMVSRALAHLEERDLILRVPDADDRRCALVRATPAGRRLVRRLRGRHARLLLERLSELPEAEMEAVLAALPALEALAAITPAEGPAPLGASGGRE